MLRRIDGAAGHILSRTTQNPAIRLALADALASIGREAEARRISIDLIRSLRNGRDCAAVPTRGLTEDAVRSAIAPQPLWHSIDFGDDLFVDGAGKPPGILALELVRMHLPDITGKTVLDVGSASASGSATSRRGRSRRSEPAST